MSFFPTETLVNLLSIFDHDYADHLLRIVYLVNDPVIPDAELVRFDAGELLGSTQTRVLFEPYEMFDYFIVGSCRKFFQLLDGGFSEFDPVCHLFLLRSL